MTWKCMRSSILLCRYVVMCDWWCSCMFISISHACHALNITSHWHHAPLWWMHITCLMCMLQHVWHHVPRSCLQFHYVDAAGGGGGCWRGGRSGRRGLPAAAPRSVRATCLTADDDDGDWVLERVDCYGHFAPITMIFSVAPMSKWREIGCYGGWRKVFYRQSLLTDTRTGETHFCS